MGQISSRGNLASRSIRTGTASLSFRTSRARPTRMRTMKSESSSNFFTPDRRRIAERLDEKGIDLSVRDRQPGQSGAHLLGNAFVIGPRRVREQHLDRAGRLPELQQAGGGDGKSGTWSFLDVFETFAGAARDFKVFIVGRFHKGRTGGRAGF